MSENIIDSLQKNNNKYIVKGILKGVKYLTYLLIVGVLHTSIDNQIKQNRDYRVLKELIERDNETTDSLALEILERNPPLIDELPNNQKHLEALERIIFPKYEQHQDRENIEGLIIENSHRVSLVSNPDIKYFSETEIDNRARLIPGFELVYDINSENLYRINRNNQLLERIIGDVKDIRFLDDSIYFIQGEDLFKKEKGKDFKLIRRCSQSPCKLYSIYGTNYSVFIGNKRDQSLFIGTDEVPKREIIDLFTALSDIELDEKSRFVYKNGALYINNEEVLLRSEKQGFETSIFKMIAPRNRDFDDYFIQDINEDGRDDFVFLDCGILVPTYDIYFRNQKGEYLKQYKINRIECEELNSSFNYSVTNHSWLNPTKLRQTLKDRLYEINQSK